MTTATATRIRPAAKVSRKPAGDAELLQSIQRALAGTGYRPLMQLHIGAHEGLVSLRGTVTSYYQKQLAQEAAMRVNGVETLQNEIVVL